MEFDLHGEIFAINHNEYDFKNDRGERIQGTSHKLTVLDRTTRTVHEVKVAEDALTTLGLKEDQKIDCVVVARASGSKMTLTFVRKLGARAASVPA